jgi:hypothetical protein
MQMDATTQRISLMGMQIDRVTESQVVAGSRAPRCPRAWRDPT